MAKRRKQKLSNSSFEDLLRKVTLGRIRNERDHSFPASQFSCDFGGSEYVRATARPGEHPFLSRQLHDHRKGIFILYHYDLVADRTIEILGYEAGPDAFDLVFTGRAAAEDRALGLNCHRPQPRQSFF